MDRRNFLKTAAGGALTALLPSRLLRSQLRSDQDPLLQRLASVADDYHSYDDELFEAAERIVFLGPHEAWLNVIPKAGKSLDLRLAISREGLSIHGDFSRQLTGVDGGKGLSIQSGFSPQLTGVDDSTDIPLLMNSRAPELVYRLEYRESRKGSWKSTAERRVKTPFSYSQTGRMEVILISDDHTFDDADMGTRIVYNPLLREARLNGDYVNMYLYELQSDPNFLPDPSADSGKMMSGFCLASTIHQVLENERPDFILLLGDSTGIGASYKWKGLGLKDPMSDLTSQDRDDISRLLWLRMRKMYSALTPYIPIYFVQGNHDGESGYDAQRISAKKYRQKYFKQPGLRQGGSIDENFLPLLWGGDFFNGGAPLFLILDNESYNLSESGLMPLKPEDWTLGTQQKAWLKELLAYDTEWKFAFFHHVLGGWPRGTNESLTDYAYGRGPLFSYDDYKDYCLDPNLVEQVELTQAMMTNRLNAIFYGHDHIFHSRIIPGSSGQKMYGICAGSSKHVGELDWYTGPLWHKFYGTYGHYWTEPSEASPSTTFWSPSGYTKITMTPGSTKVEYKRAAFNHPYANLPPSARPGDIIQTLIL
jgi:hypothetical protein